MRINNNKEIIHWNCDLKQIITTESVKKKLLFTNGKDSDEFDLIIGADGVHSEVRKLMFDKEPPHHVGANIIMVLYQMIHFQKFMKNIKEKELTGFFIFILRHTKWHQKVYCL